MTRIIPLSTIDPVAVEQLLDAAFGTDRKGRTAYRLREGLSAEVDLSFAVLDGPGTLGGTIQCWQVALEAETGGLTPMILVGPVAVAPDAQGKGIGQQLMHAALGAADAAGHGVLIMIGDPDYYERFFGFSAARTQGWDLPGPFERHRLLVRALPSTEIPAHGRIIPNPAFARPAANA